MIKYSMSNMRIIANLIWKTNQNENILMEEIQQKLNYIFKKRCLVEKISKDDLKK